MYRISQDQRTMRSSQMIYQALETLIREKPFNKITVTDVVKTAKVGRTTFYRCFDGIEDILRMRCDEVFDELIAYVIRFRMGEGSHYKGPQIKPMLRYFYLNSDIIELLLAAKRMDILQDSFRERSQGMQVAAAQHLNLEDRFIAYGVEIRVGVTLAIVTHWVRTGKREAPDELADKLNEMMSRMITIDQLM